MALDKTISLTLQWNQLILEAIRCSATSPPLAARALALVHTAMFDAWSVFDQYAISTTTAQYIKILDKKHCTPENVKKAFSYAAYRVLMDLFWLALPPENKSIFRDFMCELNYDPDDNSLDIKKPEGVGNLLARLVIEYRYGDGSNPMGTVHAPAWSDYTGYQPVNTPDKINDLNHWQPQRTKTRSGELRVQSFLVSHWGLVRPFALNHNWQFRPDVPPGKYQPQFKLQAQEVIDISAGLTDEQKVIAEYWADGPGTYTPPGHWFEIGQFIASKRNFNDSECIKMFFALGNALLDASIACWECKLQYDYVRPLTAIRELFKGKQITAWAGPHEGTKTINGENWQSYITTPPFPEYVSGHSSFSGAASTILRCFTGKDDFYGQFSFDRGSSKIEPGTTPGKTVVLSWPTFTMAARQAGMSRLYGGIHFAGANEGGLQLGLETGQLTWEKAKFYFNR